MTSCLLDCSSNIPESKDVVVFEFGFEFSKEQL